MEALHWTLPLKVSGSDKTYPTILHKSNFPGIPACVRGLTLALSFGSRRSSSTIFPQLSTRCSSVVYGGPVRRESECKQPQGQRVRSQVAGLVRELTTQLQLYILFTSTNNIKFILLIRRLTLVIANFTPSRFELKFMR